MNLPKGAKRVFKGIIFDVYQWQQEMFDGSSSTFEVLKRKNTVEVIPVFENKLLIAKQSQPTNLSFFSLFGGRQEESETQLETAKRELLEESGLVSSDWELIKTYAPEHKIIWDVFVFVARNCKRVSEQKLDSGEKISIKAVDFEEFLDVVDSEKFWGNDFANDVFRIRQDESKLKEFKKKFF